MGDRLRGDISDMGDRGDRVDMSERADMGDRADHATGVSYGLQLKSFTGSSEETGLHPTQVKKVVFHML